MHTFMVFSLMGVGLFGDKMYKCNIVSACLQICMYIYICIHLWYACIHIHAYTYDILTGGCMSFHVYTYIHTYMHTYMIGA